LPEADLAISVEIADVAVRMLFSSRDCEEHRVECQEEGYTLEDGEEGCFLEVDPITEIDQLPVYFAPVRHTDEMPRMHDLDPLLDELQDAATARMVLTSLPLEAEAAKVSGSAS